MYMNMALGSERESRCDNFMCFKRSHLCWGLSVMVRKVKTNWLRGWQPQPEPETGRGRGSGVTRRHSHNMELSYFFPDFSSRLKHFFKSIGLIFSVYSPAIAPFPVWAAGWCVTVSYLSPICVIFVIWGKSYMARLSAASSGNTNNKGTRPSN